MLFFKPKPKEKFKYLPAFNSAKFFGEKKRKTELDYKTLVKVFKPTQSIEKPLTQASIFNGENLANQIETKNQLNLPMKLVGTVGDNLQNEIDKRKQIFYNFLSSIKLILTLKTFILITLITVISLVGFLAFIDTNFIITDWQFEFGSNSYLDQSKSRELQIFLQNNRLGGVIPNNHLLFLDSNNIGLTIKDKFPEITKIEVVEKKLPNKTTLRIYTEPVLATLIIRVNSRIEFWRVAQNGKIISQDNHNLLTNAIYIDKDITYNKGEASFDQTNFFGANLEQLDKLYMIEYVKELVSNFGLKIARVTIPSLSSADKNFTIWLDNQVKLIFNSGQFDKKTIQERVQKVLNSQLITQIKSGKIQYIDLRIPYRVYVG